MIKSPLLSFDLLCLWSILSRSYLTLYGRDILPSAPMNDIHPSTLILKPSRPLLVLDHCLFRHPSLLTLSPTNLDDSSSSIPSPRTRVPLHSQI